MQDLTNRNFGLLIADVIPGFIAVVGISFHSPLTQVWHTPTSNSLPTLGGVLYVTVASVFAGMIVSTVRWATIDRIHALTGLRRPQSDFTNLQQRIAAFEALVGNQYRYHQHYASTLIAPPFAYGACLTAGGRFLSWQIRTVLPPKPRFTKGASDGSKPPSGKTRTTSGRGTMSRSSSRQGRPAVEGLDQFRSGRSALQRSPGFHSLEWKHRLPTGIVMLEITTGCQTPKRREFLQVGTLALGNLALPRLLETQAAVKAQGVPVRNKSIVMLFLTGGPSQIETFDPKMTAPSDIRSVTGEVRTPLSGVTFGATFSRMARFADRMAIVRSFTHEESDHTKAVQQVMRGGNPVVDAGLGSITARLRGTSHAGTGMPTQVYLSAQEVDKQFNKERLRLLDAAGPGQMGAAYGPFEVSGSSGSAHNMQLRIAQPRLDDRLALRRALDRLNRQVDIRGTMGEFDRFEAQAMDLLLGRSKSAFDISREDPRLLARYNTSRFSAGIHQDQASSLGHQMLLARRLCEAGCGFVTIHNPGWDMHGGPTQYNMPDGMRELGGPVDQAVSAFLEDVGDRGLSDQILLIITGEFGRTTRVKDDGGRDHWPRLSTLAFAGGGLNMGQVIGRSSADAGEPQSEPVTLDHLFATVMHTLFDVSRVRLQANLPRDIVNLLERRQPIRQLM